MESTLDSIVRSFTKLMKSNPVIFLDYDGTLVDIRMNPEDAVADHELIEKLHELSDLYETYIITGRSLSGIEGFIGNDFNIIALHGAISRINGKYMENVPDFSEYERKGNALYDRREEYTGRYAGLRIYNKHGNILFHMGLMEYEKRGSLIDEVGELAVSNNMEMYTGKMIVELRIPGINKGIAIQRIRKGRKSFIAGDDATDEEAFRLNPDALRVKIGQGETSADYTLDTTSMMRDLISRIIEIST